MNLGQQVCSLDLAKRLKELGVKQESLFGWVHDDGGEFVTDRPHEWISHIAAFTVAELGEEMGTAMTDDLLKAYCHVMDIGEEDIGTVLAYMAHNCMTQPNIPAQMLIYLIENKLITV